jgi:hypothetical protein
MHLPVTARLVRKINKMNPPCKQGGSFYFVEVS